ncbi:MAG: SWIM zinc finger domain-containing protein, partial [Isosphaeraceae bacterium]
MSIIVMGLAQQLFDKFDEGVRSRGQSYFVDNRVGLSVSTAGDAIISKVRGTVTYRVKMKLRDDQLVCSCSCPYFGEHGEPCKHIWATLLAVDAHGLLADARLHHIDLRPDPRGRDGIDKPGVPRHFEDYSDMPRAMAPRAYSGTYEGGNADNIVQRHWDGIESTAPPMPPHRPGHMPDYGVSPQPYMPQPGGYPTYARAGSMTPPGQGGYPGMPPQRRPQPPAGYGSGPGRAPTNRRQP